MPPRRQTPNNFFLGTMQRRNTSPFIARRNFQQPTAIDGISRLINETQRTINVVQQLTPLLDQFRQLSPIISNLPTLIKLMSSLEESPSTSSTTTVSEKDEIETTEIIEEVKPKDTRTTKEKNEFIKREVARILKEIGIEDD